MDKYSKSRPFRILFVDDVSYIGDCFKSLVESECEYSKVTTCTSAEQALDVLKYREFDLMITDVVMPVMDGIELTEIVRKEFDLPVILITAYAKDDVLPTGFEEYAVCCISKPYTLSEVREKIKEALRRFRHE